MYTNAALSTNYNPSLFPPAVPVSLQSPLHNGGRSGETGPGGVPEKHAQPPGVLQIHPVQTTQERPQPEKGKSSVSLQPSASALTVQGQKQKQG